MTTVNQTGIISQATKKTTPTTTNAKASLRDVVIAMQDDIAKALPKVITPERFTRIALSALSNNPKLYECSKLSFLGALMNAAQLGLEPNTPLGQAYLIPYYNNKEKRLECQFQIGYKGLLDLAYRSGEMATIQAHIVYENDDFEYELGLEPILKHKPAPSNRGNMTYAYAMFHLKNGGKAFVVMSKDDIIAHGKRYSKTYGAGPWQTDFEAMAKKTVLKQLLKYAPIRSDFLTDVETSDNKTALYNEKDGTLSIVNEETGEVIEATEIKEEINE